MEIPNSPRLGAETEQYPVPLNELPMPSAPNSFDGQKMISADIDASVDNFENSPNADDHKMDEDELTLDYVEKMLRSFHQAEEPPQVQHRSSTMFNGIPSLITRRSIGGGDEWSSSISPPTLTPTRVTESPQFNSLRQSHSQSTIINTLKNTSEQLMVQQQRQLVSENSELFQSAPEPKSPLMVAAYSAASAASSVLAPLDYSVPPSPIDCDGFRSSWSPLSHCPRNFTTHEGGEGGAVDKYAYMVDNTQQPGSNIYKSGYLVKQGGSWNTWKRRFFVLQNKNIFYFRSERDSKKENATPLGVVPLTSFFSLVKCNPTVSEERISGMCIGFLARKPSFMFKIETVQRTWILYSETEEEQLDWIRVIQDVEISNKRQSEGSVGDSSIPDVLARGWLEKHTKGVVRRRWCVLQPQSLLLYKAPGDHMPCASMDLVKSSHFLELVPFSEDESEGEDTKVTKKNNSDDMVFRFAITSRDGTTHWFRCDSGDHLEVWTHALLSVITLLPSCKTVFETLMDDIVLSVVENDLDPSLEDPAHFAYLEHVRNDNAILRYNAQMQGVPVTTLATRILTEEAFNIAHAITFFSETLVDSEEIETHLALVQALIKSCMDKPALQNELLLQLVKQTSDCPDCQSTSFLQTWQLFALAVSVFTPVRNAYHYVRFHLVHVISTCKDTIAGQYAYYCLRVMLQLGEDEAISDLGSKNTSTLSSHASRRKCPPSYMESLNILNTSEPPSPLRVLVECKNDEFLSLPFEPFSKVQEVVDTLVGALGVGTPDSILRVDEYCLFLRNPDDEGNFTDDSLEKLSGKTFMADVLYALDVRMRAITGKGPMKWWWMNEKNNPYLVFKIRFFLPLLKNPKGSIAAFLAANASETEKRFIINYMIQNVSFRRFRIEDLLNMTAYYAQFHWGDHFPLIQNRNLVHSQIQFLLEIFHRDFAPLNKISTKPGQVFQVVSEKDTLIGEISNKWMCLRGKSTEKCMDSFIKLCVNTIAKYSYRVYIECHGQDLGDICKLELSVSGLRIIRSGKLVIQCGYDGIAYYVEGDEKSMILGVKSSAIDERILGKKGSDSDAVRITVLLADEKTLSSDFVHILRYFNELTV